MVVYDEGKRLMSKKRFIQLVGYLFGFWVLNVSVCHALAFRVTLDTSPLIEHPAEPFSIEFQLNDGSGTGDANNRARVSNFNFGSGSVGRMLPTLVGGAAGDLSAAVTLCDSGFLNEFFQEFIPGNTLSFTVTLTTGVDPGPQPDRFSFAILDCATVEIPTLGPGDPLVAVDINSRNPVIETFAGNPNGVLACNDGSGIALPAPRVAPIPEPTSLALFGIGILGMLACGWIRQMPGRKTGVRAAWH